MSATMPVVATMFNGSDVVENVIETNKIRLESVIKHPF
jgi:hypothetical protein